MLTVSEVSSFLNSFAPPALAESWDNTGLLIGRESAEVSVVMTCLTITPDVAHEAVRERVQLIVSHHPILFRAVRQMTDRTTEGATLLRLIEAGIAVYCPHTAFDSAPQGINQGIAAALHLQDIAPLRPSVPGAIVGAGRIGRLPQPLVLSEFLPMVGVILNAERIEYSGDPTGQVSRVAVACGAADDLLPDAIRCDCDTFVTGESRLHTVLEARSRGVQLILAGHFSSERPAVEQLAEVIAGQFRETRVFASRSERNPLQVWHNPGASPASDRISQNPQPHQPETPSGTCS